MRGTTEAGADGRRKVSKGGSHSLSLSLVGTRGEWPTALNRLTMRQVPALRKPRSRSPLVIVVFAPIVRHCLARFSPSLHASKIRHRVYSVTPDGIVISRIVWEFTHPRKTRTFELSRLRLKCVE